MRPNRVIIKHKIYLRLRHSRESVYLPYQLCLQVEWGQASLFRLWPLWWHWPIWYISSFLERTCDVLAPSLSVVFRRLLRLGSFHACWRQANITPIPKDSLSSSLDNYRQISITWVLSLTCLSDWCRFVSGDLWNAVVCFHPPIFLIGNFWVPAMHFYACLIHCWEQCVDCVGLSRLTLAQPLIGSTIREFYISSALWILEVLCCLYWHSFYQINHSMLWCAVVWVNWLTLCQERRWAVFWACSCSSVHHGAFYILENQLIGYADDTTLIVAVVPSPGVRVTAAKWRRQG